MHGGLSEESSYRIGDEKLTLDEAANKACEVLRGVINRFLPKTDTAPYKNPKFWERGYFDVTPVP